MTGIDAWRRFSLSPLQRRPPGPFSSRPKQAAAAESPSRLSKNPGRRCLSSSYLAFVTIGANALARMKNALFVVATHGVGEAPEGTEIFFSACCAEHSRPSWTMPSRLTSALLPLLLSGRQPGLGKGLEWIAADPESSGHNSDLNSARINATRQEFDTHRSLSAQFLDRIDQ